MKVRPWPIVFIALLHFLLPLFSLFIIYKFFEIAPIDYFNLLLKNNDYVPLMLHLSFPLAGLVIILYKKWSLPLFWMIELGALIFNCIFFYKANQAQMINLSVLFFILTILNVLITSYFLLPVVMRSFFDQSLHWWESKNRCDLEITAEIFYNEQVHSGKILNISETGVFFKLNQSKIPNLQDIKIVFSYGKLHFSEIAFIQHYHQGKDGYGAFFKDTTSQSKKKLKDLIKALSLLGLQSSRDEINKWNDFKLWLKNLFKGQGLVPQIPNKNS